VVDAEFTFHSRFLLAAADASEPFPSAPVLTYED
jgi:hypothetical protein